MRKMKETGLGWLKEIPEDWQISKIKYVATLSPSCDRSELTAESVITYTPMEYIKNGAFINNTEQYGNVPASLTPYQDGDIAMAKVTPCFENGNIAVMEGLANGFGLGSSELIIFRPENIETRFLFYWLRNTAFVERAISTITGTGGLKRISTEFVRNSEIPLPDATEQRKISEYLDKKCSQLDSIIDRQHHVIAKLQAYKLSVITEAITKGLYPDVPMKDSGITWIGKIPESYTITKLKYLTNSIIDGTHATPTYVPDGIPFVRVTDITNAQNTDSQIDLNNVVRIPVEEHNELIKRCKPEKGDLLVSKNGTIGIPKVVDWDWEFSIFVSLCLLKLRDNIDAKYLMYYFKSSLVDYEIAINGKKGTITNLHLEKIRNFNIPCPNVDTQKQVVDYLDRKCAAIDSSIAKRQQLIDKLTEYKKSLIFEVVTGKKEV